MIDFRFHLISIVAVFLALGIGILMGSLALGDNLVRHLENRVTEVRERNDELLAEVGRLRAMVEGFESFGAAVEPMLVDGALAGTEVVLVELSGGDGGLGSRVASAVEDAGGGIAATVRLTERFALGGDAEIDQLALIIGSTSGDPAQLRLEAGAEIARLMGAGASAQVEGEELLAAGRLQMLLEALSEAGFVVSDPAAEDLRIPGDAAFLVVGGGSDESDFDPRGMMVEVSTELAESGSPTVLAEPSESEWGLVRALRADEAGRAVVATGDQVETVAGRIAVVLALETAAAGRVGHFGTGPGAEGIIPSPTPTG
jgi:hypothetical protein